MRKLSKSEFKIKFDNESTRVYQGNGVTVAELSGWVTVPEFSGWYNCPVAMDPFYVKAKGVARVMVDDDYDDDKGRRIALAKAENKVYDAALREIMKRVDELLKFNDIAFKFRDKVESIKEHNVKYIKEIGG